MSNIAQTSLSGIAALAVTFGLFAIMNSLITTNYTIPTNPTALKVPDVHWEEKTIEDIPTQPLEEIETTPPPPTTVLTAERDIPTTNDTIIITNPTTPDPIITGPTQMDSAFLPLVKVAAIYPTRALARGIEGHCTVIYTVTTTGAVSNVRVDQNDCTHSVFHKNSVKAAQKFKYNPRVVNGQAIESHGVRNRFTFQMAK